MFKSMILFMSADGTLCAWLLFLAVYFASLGSVVMEEIPISLALYFCSDCVQLLLQSWHGHRPVYLHLGMSRCSKTA